MGRWMDGQGREMETGRERNGGSRGGEGASKTDGESEWQTDTRGTDGREWEMGGQKGEWERQTERREGQTDKGERRRRGRERCGWRWGEKWEDGAGGERQMDKGERLGQTGEGEKYGDWGREKWAERRRHQGMWRVCH